MTIAGFQESRALLFSLIAAAVTTRVWAADCNQNGVEDHEDLLGGVSRDCNRNSIPDECDLSPSVSFSGARKFVTGIVDPRSVEAGDLDGDGLLDLVVPSRGSDSLSILWNGGERNFGDGLNLPAGESPMSAAVADLNGDGKRDLAVGGASGIAFLRNEGGRMFQQAGSVVVVADVVVVRAADLEGDGDSDIVAARSMIAGEGPDRVEVILNDGGWVFAPPRSFEVGRGARALVAIDLDVDGRIDLATANQIDGTVSILWGDGKASFPSILTASIGVGPRDLAAADLDGDGDADLVATSFAWGVDAGSIFILWNQSGRSFREAVGLPLPDSQPTSVTATDLDRDGDLDLAVLDRRHKRLVVLWNAGGEFASTSDVPLNPVMGEPRALIAAEFDGDGAMDLAFVNDSSVVVALWNMGDGSMGQEQAISTAMIPVSIVARDLDGDSDLDIATANSFSDNVSVLLNSGSGTLSTAVSYRAGTWPRAIAPGDLDGDGRQDLAVANRASNDASVLWNRGDGSFTPPLSLGAGKGPSFVALGDVDGDRDLDIAVANGDSENVSLILNLGGRAFSGAVSLNVGSGPRSMALFDADRDGDLDIATCNSASHDVSILLNAGGLRFEGPSRFSLARAEPVSLSAGDIDNDGAEDLVTMNRESRSFSVLWNDGIGRFDAVTTKRINVSTDAQVSVGDLDADGDLDIAVATGSLLTVAWNGGGRSFSSPMSLYTGGYGIASSIGDLNGDGLQDLAIANFYPSAHVAVLLGRRGSAHSGDRDLDGSPDECDLDAFIRGNSNDDGAVDIADPVFTLAHLFLGGTAPPCSDAADANDDGAVDISDAVYTLDFLFRGGAAPPAPGPMVPGADATPLDSLLCRLPPAPTCAALPASTLPGVRFDTTATPCTITLDEAAAGVDLPYTVVIEEDIAADFYPLTEGGCHSLNAGGLSVSERIYGNGEIYCLCDTGLCPGFQQSIDLKPGRFDDRFRWNGRNWHGPSDFGAGFGPPFPPGRYKFEVVAFGVFRDADGVEAAFTVRGESEFDLVP